MHHRLHASPDRLKATQPQQVQGCGPQRSHRYGAIAPLVMAVLLQLGVADSVPALNSPTGSHLLQQCFWGSAQASEKQVHSLKRLAAAAAGGADLHDPAGADLRLADVIRCLLCPQAAGDVAAVADLVICCHERDPALSLELAADLAAQRLLFGFHCQEEVGPLLLKLSKNGFCVWRASDWMRASSKSSSLSSFSSTARSLLSLVA